MEMRTTPNLTRSTLALAISFGLVAPSYADLLISQYVEGSSFNKAIEIANTSDQTVSLNGYQLAMSTNGSGTWDKTLPLDGQVIAARDVLVIAHGSANSAILATADLTNNTVVNFNGNDPIALLNSDGSVHDVVGSMGGADLRKTTRSPEQHSPQALLTKLPIGRPKAKTILMGLAHWIPPRHRVPSIVR